MTDFVFVFKQKTADEMRISDWSSDVCSSDLLDFILGNTYKDVPYACLNKRIATGESAIMDPNLSTLGPYLKIFSSSIKDVTAHRKAMDKYGDRKSAVEGKSVSVRVDLGVRRFIKTKTESTTQSQTNTQ